MFLDSQSKLKMYLLRVDETSRVMLPEMCDHDRDYPRFLDTTHDKYYVSTFMHTYVPLAESVSSRLCGQMLLKRVSLTFNVIILY